MLVIWLRDCKGPIETRAVGALTSMEEVVTSGRNKSSFEPLSKVEVDGVEKFVSFIGFSRSGHSFVGAMMDAHPNVVIAHEYYVLRKCLPQKQPQLQSKAALFNALYKNSYSQSQDGWRSESKSKKDAKKSVQRRGYNLHINTKWQGSFSQLRVIGDKGAGSLSDSFFQNPRSTTECFNLLKETVKVPVVLLHVVRNPFDMIATRLALRHDVWNTRKMVEKGKKVKLRRKEIQEHATHVFRKAEAISEAINSDAMKDVTVVEIHIESFIKNPGEHINKVCEALGIPCPVEYVEACTKKTFSNVSHSRQVIDWDDDVVKSILKRMKNIPFYSSYTFDIEHI